MDFFKSTSLFLPCFNFPRLDLLDGTNIPGLGAVVNAIGTNTLGAAVTGYFIFQGVNFVYKGASNLSNSIQLRYATRSGAWITKDLENKELTQEDISTGDALHARVKNLEFEIAAKEAPPTDLCKVAILVLLIALSCLSLLFGNAMIASMPVLLATIATIDYFWEQIKHQAEAKERNKELEEAKEALKSHMALLLKDRPDKAANSSHQNIWFKGWVDGVKELGNWIAPFQFTDSPNVTTTNLPLSEEFSLERISATLGAEVEQSEETMLKRERERSKEDEEFEKLCMEVLAESI